LFSVGILSDRLPICPSGYAVTVTHDGLKDKKPTRIRAYFARFTESAVYFAYSVFNERFRRERQLNARS
jgi:hypothetical protein